MSKVTMTGVERWSIWGLIGFTAVAVLGYGIFALHPERIPTDDFSLAFFTHSFAWFARLHILLSAVVLAIAFFGRSGTRWLIAFGAVFGLSFMAEHIGTGTGFPFSGYSYTALLGPRIGGRVPWVIPISWFLMSAVAWILARRSFPDRTAGRLLFATWLLVLWDLALDPAMSFLTPYWLWEVEGPYYGMPLVNLVGWFGTGLVLMVALDWLDRRINWAGEVTVDWALWYYLAVLAMPLGMLIAYGAWLAVLVTAGALAVSWGIHLWVTAPTGTPLASEAEAGGCV